MLNPNTTTMVPIHFPKINPPIKATGDPKPKRGNTHKIVKPKKIKNIRIRLDFFNSEKNSILSLMKS